MCVRHTRSGEQQQCEPDTDVRVRQLFLFDNPFTPRGAPEAVKCDTNCTAAWFSEGGNGLYLIFLRPAPADPQKNWKAGMYAATIYVYDGEAGVGRILVTWVIPAAPNVNQ